MAGETEIIFYGESAEAKVIREIALLAANWECENIRVKPETLFRGSPLPTSPIGLASPVAYNIGLGHSMPSVDPSRLFKSDVTFNWTQETLNSAPHTPKLPSSNLPNPIKLGIRNNPPKN